MQHLSDALNVLHEKCGWFARAREVRLLVVRTSGDVRRSVVKLIPRYEFHADNRSPWILLEDSYEPSALLWESRAARLLRDWERRREAFAREGTHLPAATPRQSVDTSRTGAPPGLALFASACVAVLDALHPPLEGLVLVVAPTIVDGAEALDSDLGALFRLPVFDASRIVLVLDVDAGLPRRTLEQMGGAAMVCECVTDPDVKRRDLHSLIGGADNSGCPVAGAWPVSAVPPRRPNAPPELDPETRDAALRQAGVAPEYIEHAPELRRLILGAALAMGEGRKAEGIRMQAETVRLSRQVGMPQMMILCQITLASYLSAAGDRPSALEELAAAETSAAQHRLPDQESQACLAQGLLLMLERRLLDAADAYRRCATVAESANADILAIEAWRLAGHAALEGGTTEQGVQYLRQALRVAGELDPPARASTSAAEVARRLARVYSEAGYSGHAHTLHTQADAIERGTAAGLESGESRRRDDADAGGSREF